MAVSLSGMTLISDNDTQDSWAGTDDLDAYNTSIQGTNSESWNVAKNATETGTLSVTVSLNATRGLVVFWFKSDLAAYYTDITCELESSNNNYKSFTVANSTNKAIGGNFVASALDFINKGTETGTLVPGSLTVIRFIVNNSASGNIRSVINNWIDAIYHGEGQTVSGTTTSDKLFEEAAAVDQTTANQYGILENYNDIIYSQGDIDLSGTALTSDSETLVFKDTLNGYSTYNFDITGTVELINSNIIAAGTIGYNFDSSTATSLTINGGTISGFSTLIFNTGQTVSGAVFQAGGTSTIPNTVSDSTFNQCGLITVTGLLESCVIDKSSATIATSVSNLNKLDGCSFISDGTGHAVDLGTVAATQTMNWNNNDTAYASSDGSTGNETIKVNVNSGQVLTINVGAGYSTPTIYNTGTGTVSVVAGQVTLTITVKDIVTGSVIQNAMVYITADAGGSLTEGTAIIDKVLTDVSGQVSDTRSYSSNQPITGRIRKSTGSPYYKTSPVAGTVDNASGLSLTVQMIKDE